MSDDIDEIMPEKKRKKQKRYKKGFKRKYGNVIKL